MDLGISGRRALVGGGSAGLGLATAERLAGEGCAVAIWARKGDRLEAAAAGLRARHPVDVVAIAADAADPACATLVAEAAVRALGGVDILVLNAGGPPPARADATDPAGWAAAFQLLASTPIELATLLLPGMRERRWGRILGILSYVVREPDPILVYSNAGRSALMAWMKTLAREVASDGVTVNGVFPGRHDTDRIRFLDRSAAERSGRTEGEVRAELAARIPMGRYGTADEVAALLAYLASEPARYQTGTFTQVDGGLLAALP